MDRISTHGLADAAGVTYRRVDYWCRIGVIHPARPARGSGSRRRFTYPETLVTAAVGVLADLGATEPVLTPAAEYLRHIDPDRWDGAVFVTTGGEVVHDVDLVGSAGWLVDLGIVADQVNDRRHALVAA